MIVAHAVVWDGAARRLYVSRAPRGLADYVAYDVGAFFDAKSAPAPGSLRVDAAAVAALPDVALAEQIARAANSCVRPRRNGRPATRPPRCAMRRRPRGSWTAPRRCSRRRKRCSFSDATTRRARGFARAASSTGSRRRRGATAEDRGRKAKRD